MHRWSKLSLVRDLQQLLQELYLVCAICALDQKNEKSFHKAFHTSLVGTVPATITIFSYFQR